ncbi:MAG: hypothetical protein AAGF27_11185 [Pseudomonadota bacterium]
MTLEQLALIAQQLLTLSALAGATWSAFVFVKNISEKREAARKQELANWRRTSVHRLLHASERFMSVSEITDALRTQSYDVPIEVKKDELTEATVRFLLMRMLETDVVKQLPGDRYGISHFDFQAEISERTAYSIRMAKGAYEFIFELPGAFTTQKLYEKVVLQQGLRNLTIADFHLMLSQLTNIGAAFEDDQGKWYSHSHKLYPTNNSDDRMRLNAPQTES